MKRARQRSEVLQHEHHRDERLPSEVAHDVGIDTLQKRKSLAKHSAPPPPPAPGIRRGHEEGHVWHLVNTYGPVRVSVTRWAPDTNHAEEV